ncbi:MAG: alpha/beta fold hydrolase [Asgard group archaeon]|nr:alpha/beta fold hydrolase [Asgard group archaeon]
MSQASHVGFLLIHGLGSNNKAMKPLEQFLTSQGYVVDNIYLPEFNSTPEDLQAVEWLEWINYSQERLNILKDQCNSVYVSGTSSGGVIALYLCSTNRDLAGVITFATAVKPFNFISWFVYIFRPIQFIFRWINVGKHREKYIGKFIDWYGYDRLPMSALIQTARLLDVIGRKLKLVHQPILLLHGINDRLVPIKTMKQIIRKIKSRDITTVKILEGGHLVLLDRGSNQALIEIEKWLEKRIG